MTHDITPTEPLWVVAHNGTSIAHYAALDAGAQFSTGMPHVEQFASEAEADARMRDFDPVWKVGPFDVNAATETELQDLPGVGAATAAAIVQGRPYETTSALTTVDGISASMVSEWGAAVFVDPETFENYELNAAPPPTPVPPYPLKHALAQLASLRWEKEVGGLTLPDGSSVQTHREAQAQLTGTVASYEKGYIDGPINWKTKDGWAELDWTAIEAIAAAVARHVQACFTAEKAVEARLEVMDFYWQADLNAMFAEEYAAAMEA